METSVARSLVEGFLKAFSVKATTEIQNAIVTLIDACGGTSFVNAHAQKFECDWGEQNFHAAGIIGGWHREPVDQCEVAYQGMRLHLSRSTLRFLLQQCSST
jgi:hypothetical protein